MIDIVAAFFIAIMVGMGIGGGGFLVIYLTLCMNYPQIIAQGTNLLFFIICGASSLFIHQRKRNLFSRELAFITALSIPGTLIGSHLANTVDPKIPKIALGILLTVSGSITLIKIIKQMISEKNKKI